MERLTEYDEFGNAEFVGIDNTKLYERLVCDETVALTIATNKLAEFEDFMEEIGAKSLEEIKQLLIANSKLTKAVMGLDVEYICKCLLEYPSLKDRWQKLKEWFEHKEWDMPTSRDRALKKMQELEEK